MKRQNKESAEFQFQLTEDLARRDMEKMIESKERSPQSQGEELSIESRFEKIEKRLETLEAVRS